MSNLSSAELARRVAWADQENQRRQREHQRADFAWATDDQALAWMIAAAHANPVRAPEELGTSFVPKRGESLAGAFVGCRLIEVKRGASTHRGGSSGFSFRISRGISYHVGGSQGTSLPGAEGLRITDGGDVVVTNKRVVFRGELKSREWAYSKVIGIHHDPARPVTMIHVSNRQNVSGIAYPADKAAEVRFALELGAAQEFGTTGALIAGLQRERSEHARMRPLPLPPVTPAQAPSRGAGIPSGLMALLTGRPGQPARRRIVHTALAGGVALLALNAGFGALTRGAVTAAPQASVAAAPVSFGATATAPVPTSSPTPSLEPDAVVTKIKVGPKPTAPRLLATEGTPERVGATCKDGTHSYATGRGACSWHDGVRTWLYGQPAWVEENIATNAKRVEAYKTALKAWKTKTARNTLLRDYPCTKGPYPEGSAGYASWRDTNHNGVACDR